MNVPQRGAACAAPSRTLKWRNPMPHIHRKTLFALSIALLIMCLSTSLAFAQSGASGIVSSPNQGTLGNKLYGVATVSANDIWAVGSYTDQQSQSGSLTLHWNGTTWSQVSNPGATTLYGVTAVASNNVWAVGAFTTQQSRFGPLILHWNGTSWSIVDSPHAGTLAAVAAVSANDIWAVGYELSVYYYYTVIEHWNGKTWSQVS